MTHLRIRGLLHAAALLALVSHCSSSSPGTTKGTSDAAPGDEVAGDASAGDDAISDDADDPGDVDPSAPKSCEGTGTRGASAPVPADHRTTGTCDPTPTSPPSPGDAAAIAVACTTDAD